MTMRKRLPALVLSLLLVLALCACGESKVDYPALDAPDLDTMTLSEVANGSVREVRRQRVAGRSEHRSADVLLSGGYVR